MNTNIKVNHNGANQIELVLGNNITMLTNQQALNLGGILIDAAMRDSDDEHIDNIFNAWGKDNWTDGL